MADRNNIFFDEEKISEEELIRYLNEDISDEEKNFLEKKITGSFENDALEGLLKIENKVQLQHHVQKLNKKLPYLLRHKKLRSKKTLLKDFGWIALTLLILLFACIITYVVITMHA